MSFRARAVDLELLCRHWYEKVAQDSAAWPLQNLCCESFLNSLLTGRDSMYTKCVVRKSVWPSLKECGARGWSRSSDEVQASLV